MASLFTRIIRGEISCHRVAETGSCLAFLDINPVARGHVLAIPKAEVDYLFDLDDATLADLMQFSKRTALAIGRVIPCKRVGVTVIGLEVPHAHVHLIPINDIGDMNFSQPKLKIPEAEMAALPRQIAGAFEKS